MATHSAAWRDSWQIDKYLNAVRSALLEGPDPVSGIHAQYVGYRDRLQELWFEALPHLAKWFKAETTTPEDRAAAFNRAATSFWSAKLQPEDIGEKIVCPYS